MTSEFAGTGDKGAHYHRCDFQVHSPRDRQWTGAPRVTDEERAEYAASLIAACRDKGLDAIAITDHHDMAFVRYVRNAAAQETDAEGNPLSDRERIVVFPGIELTLAVPCQAIMLLDADFEDNRFDAVLTALAINPAAATDSKTAQTERLENLDSLKSLKTKLDDRDCGWQRHAVHLASPFRSGCQLGRRISAFGSVGVFAGLASFTGHSVRRATTPCHPLAAPRRALLCRRFARHHQRSAFGDPRSLRGGMDNIDNSECVLPYHLAPGTPRPLDDVLHGLCLSAASK